MTDESSRNGEPQYPYDPQLPLYSESRAPDAPAPSEPHAQGAPAPSGPQPPETPVLSGTVHPAGGHPGFPPPPPYDPYGQAAAPGPFGEPAAPARRRRVPRPVALMAAAAVAAGLIGGGVGAFIGHATGDSASGSVHAAATSSAAVNAAALDGTVAGVVKAVDPSVVEITASSSQGKATGSGVIITADGQVVTNNHVVAGAQQISVTYASGKSAAAKVVGTDAKKDLALIKIQGASNLPAATLGDSSSVAIGDQVVAIGSPEGLSNTVTSGIVSALNREVTVPVETGQNQNSQGFGQGGNGGRGGDQWPFSFGGNQYNGDTGSSTTTYKAIQTDASLNPGNSGGALINMAGQIIGINSAMYSDSSSDGSSSSSSGSVGLGFAIPVNTVKADLPTLRAGGADSTSGTNGTS
ncbi:S1C family serine protease [Streptomyces sp. NRRL F-5123]|uniref:S1C family serine protease n=1 Tax=Streptomyces sp. NRRL F-5123 TaxID=1463856 RepID=UPI0004E1779B|nr:trypsin-like peptidase domain-containing protein [Streptomyces sp. NRRL F-5123]